MLNEAALPPLPEKPGNADNWVDKAGGLPGYIDRIARHLHYERGMDVGRAIATAVAIVRKVCATGKPHASARGEWNAKSHAEACAAAAEWEKKKAASHAKSALREAERVPISLGWSVSACWRVLEAVGDASAGATAAGGGDAWALPDALRDPFVVASLMEHGVVSVRLFDGGVLMEAASPLALRGRGGGALKVWDESWVIRNRIGQFAEWVKRIPVGGHGILGHGGATVRREHDGSVSVVGADGAVVARNLHRIEDIADAAQRAKDASAESDAKPKVYSVGVRVHTLSNDPLYQGQRVGLFVDVKAKNPEHAAALAKRALSDGSRGQRARRFLDLSKGIEVLNVQSDAATKSGAPAPDLPQPGLFDTPPSASKSPVDAWQAKHDAARADAEGKVAALSPSGKAELAAKIKAHNEGDVEASRWLVDNGFAQARSWESASFARSRGDKGSSADAYDAQRAVERSLARDEVAAMTPAQVDAVAALSFKADYGRYGGVSRRGAQSEQAAAHAEMVRIAPYTASLDREDRGKLLATARADHERRAAYGKKGAESAGAGIPGPNVVGGSSAHGRDAFTGQASAPDMDSTDEQAWAAHYDRQVAGLSSSERFAVRERMRTGGYHGEGTLVPIGRGTPAALRQLGLALDRRDAGTPAMLGDLKVGDGFYIRRSDGQPNKASGWMVVKSIARDDAGVHVTVQASTGKTRTVDAGPKMRVFKMDRPGVSAEHGRNAERASAAASPSGESIDQIAEPKAEWVKMAALAGSANVKDAAKRYNAKYPEAAQEIDSGDAVVLVSMAEGGDALVSIGVRAKDGGWIAASNKARFRVSIPQRGIKSLDDVWAARRRALQRELGHLPIPVEVHTAGRKDVRRLDRAEDWAPQAA